MDELSFKQLCDDLLNVNPSGLKTYELTNLLRSVNIAKRRLDKELSNRERIMWSNEID